MVYFICFSENETADDLFENFEDTGSFIKSYDLENQLFYICLSQKFSKFLRIIYLINDSKKLEKKNIKNEIFLDFNQLEKFCKINTKIIENKPKFELNLKFEFQKL